MLQDVYNKKGIKGFYAGLKPDLLRLLPSNSIVFIVYEFMKRHIHIAMEWTLITFYCFYFIFIIKSPKIISKKEMYLKIETDLPFLCFE